MTNQDIMGPKIDLTFAEEKSMNSNLVHTFSRRMIDRMGMAMLNGKSNWWDKEIFPTEELKDRLIKAISAGDFVDAANYMAMAETRGDKITIGVY